MRAVPLYVLVVLVAAPAARAAPAQAAPSLAMMPFHTENLDAAATSSLATSLRAKAAQRGGYDVQPDSTTQPLVQASKDLGLDCDVNAVECGVKIGQLADVQFLLLGRAVGGLDGAIGVDVRLIDVSASAELRRATMLMPADREQQSDALNAFAEALFSTSPLGALPVDVTPAGAAIVVDGSARGVVPLSFPVASLLPGDHWVVVKKDGYAPYQARVSVKAGTNPPLVVTLAPLSSSAGAAVAHTPSSTPFLVAGAGGVVAVAGGVAAIIGFLPYGRYRQGLETLNSVDATQDPLPPADVKKIAEGYDKADKGSKEWDSYGRTTFIVGLVGLVVGLGVAAAGSAWGLVPGDVASTQGDVPKTPPPP